MNMNYNNDLYSPNDKLMLLPDYCARGVMVIVVGNGYGNTSSKPGRD